MGNRHRAVSMSFNGSVSRDEEQHALKSLADLRGIYKDIRYEWPQVLQKELTPLELAIALLDDTSVGLAHRKPEFDELCGATAEALRTVVIENHELFNNSVGLYHVLMLIAKDSQEDSLKISKLIEESTRDMSGRAQHMREMDNSVIKYSEMIEILDAMESLHKMPDRVDKLVSEKKINEVYDAIAQGYATAKKYNLWSLSAMSATQNYLEMQSNNLYDLIVDELKNEIYLRNLSLSNSDQFSWLSLVSNASQFKIFVNLLRELTSLELYIHESANLDISELAESVLWPAKDFLTGQLPKLHKQYFNTDTAKINYSLLMDSSLSSGIESCHYIYMLLLTAFKLNRLDNVLEILEASAQEELHSLIEQATKESEQKNILAITRLKKMVHPETWFDVISGATFNDISVPVLLDLSASIFLKCLSMLSRHKVVFEIVKLFRSATSISSAQPRNLISSPSTVYDFSVIYENTNREIENFIMAYLHDPSTKGGAFKKTEAATGVLLNVFTPGSLFRLDKVSDDVYHQSSEDMKAVLDEVFPGFLVDSKTSALDESPYISTEKFNEAVHVLVPKNIFNMRIVLECFLMYTSGSLLLFTDFNLERQNSIAPAAFTAFMTNSFLYELKEILLRGFDRCMHGTEIFDGSSNLRPFQQATVNLQSEGRTRASNTSYEPSTVYENAVQFKKLLHHACHCINTSFIYRKDLSDLVLDLLRKFSKAYSDYCRELVSNGVINDITNVRLGLSDKTKNQLRISKWLTIPSLVEASGEVLQHFKDPDVCMAYVEKETEWLYQGLSSKSILAEISKDDVLDDEWLNQMCYLLLTSTWILSWLVPMRKESNYTLEGQGRGSEIERLRNEWSFLENGRSLHERSQHVMLTLNSAKVTEFDNIIREFELVRDDVLIALRYDLRLKCLYYIGKSSQDLFVLSTEPADADPLVSALNKEIFYFGSRITTLLTKEEKDCILVGLTHFLNATFIEASKLIAVANRNGIKKIVLNIFTVQQMLRSFMSDLDTLDLGHASKYFEMFTLPEHRLVQEIADKKNKYKRSDVVNLVRLIYSEKLSSESATSFNKSKYQELTKKVGEIFS